MYRSYKLSIWK